MKRLRSVWHELDWRARVAVTIIAIIAAWLLLVAVRYFGMV